MKFNESINKLSSYENSRRSMTETQVSLNVHEVGVILSALQLLENVDENRIAREYGSAPALYSKLQNVWLQMDRSETGLRYETEPSF